MIKGMFGFIGARNKSALTLVGSMGLALCLVSALAYADTFGGHAGHGWPNSAVSCFQGSWSRMINNCNTTQTLVIPLHTRSVSTTHMIVRASGSGSTFTSCKGIRNDLDNNGWFTSTQYFGSSLSSLVLGDLFAPASNTLSVECSVAGNGGFVQSVDWTQ